jgi:DNA-binding MarR family transcriptional regulator
MAIPSTDEVGAPSAPARAMDGLRRLVRILRSSNTASERKIGLTAAQLFVLTYIAEHSGGSLRDVAACTLTTQSTASEVVARLVDRGLVQRTIDSTDRRRVVLSATAIGRATLHRGDPPVQQRLIAALTQLPIEQQESIAGGLAAWLEAAGFSALSPVMFFEPDAQSTAQLSTPHKGRLQMPYQPIDPTWTVNDVLLRYPQTASVFTAFSVDSCCGGALALEVVASKHGLDLKILIGALEESVGSPARAEACV